MITKPIREIPSQEHLIHFCTRHNVFSGNVSLPWNLCEFPCTGSSTGVHSSASMFLYCSSVFVIGSPPPSTAFIPQWSRQFPDPVIQQSKYSGAAGGVLAENKHFQYNTFDIFKGHVLHWRDPIVSPKLVSWHWKLSSFKGFSWMIPRLDTS